MKNRHGQFFHSHHDYGSQTKNNAYLLLVQVTDIVKLLNAYSNQKTGSIYIYRNIIKQKRQMHIIYVNRTDIILEKML